MIDKYVIRGINEIWYHLKKYKDRTDEWRADFYDEEEQLICSFEGDEETMERLKSDEETYAMVTAIKLKKIVFFVVLFGTIFGILYYKFF